MKRIQFMDLGLCEYGAAWEKQEDLMKEIIDQKSLKAQSSDFQTHRMSGYFLFVEHPAVYTLGKSGESENLLLNSAQMADKRVSFYRTNRGGDITFHGPGQLVGYPILDLEEFGMGLRHYIYSIEEIIIRTLNHYGIRAFRDPGATGVWLEPGTSAARKICAIGVRSSRYVTMHGFALNVNTDLSYFDYINPCGLIGKGVTSMEKETGQQHDANEVKRIIKSEFATIFGLKQEDIDD